MPELPEVETVARGLRRMLPGTRLVRAELRRRDIARIGAADWPRLEGLEWGAVERAGKYLLFTLRRRTPRGQGRPAWRLMIHLGMTGQLRISQAGEAEPAHTHAIFYLENGNQLRFQDPRRFGRLGLLPLDEETDIAEADARLGVAPGREPLEIGEAEFIELFRGSQAPIKSALLDQKRLRGVGNIYADESLHRAGIAPRARGISRPRLLRLRRELRAVLRAAIRAGGSSVSDYVNSEGERGWFQMQHRVYGREGQPCRQCGAKLRRVEISGRSAHYCPQCQRLG